MKSESSVNEKHDDEVKVTKVDALADKYAPISGPVFS